VLDGTAGNGNDTEFLARIVGEQGQVLAFDIQPEAISSARARLTLAGLHSRVRLIQESHESLSRYVEKDHKIAAGMYNLGYLPGAEHGVTTRADSTIASLEQLVKLVTPGGIVSVHCYTGQEYGEEELLAVQGWAGGLTWADWRVARYEFCNKPFNREVLFLIQRFG
jgi:predicted O-methyltransferase YrrM